MSNSAESTLLAGYRWVGKIFNGGWIASHGGTREITEPANGRVLANIGVGNAVDIEAAAERAAIAQKSWVALGAMRAVAPALASGNAVVLKPDAQTSLTGGVIIARAFEEAGLPSGVLHLVPGGADAGEALCRSRHVHMIQFTGSTAVGRRVAELA